ncbi:MAG: 2-oxoacid:acceptor oxidoreductase subunit alpha [Chloroflexi bacterium]|nr:2-oxoacid:acceptor oxidoreductase subunit alpha [Chloroflexota bacterium]
MREFIDGSTAIVRGALGAGCTFFAGYPITPASPILSQMLAELPKLGGTAIQAEDEIASIGMCLGAVMAGARAMTATSGPGISLYSETIGLAIMAELPLVIVDVQRMGPATGGATTPAQGDIQFLRWGSSGGYPIIALAPSSVAECFGLTRRAFDLAERYRCPVFLVADKALSSTRVSVELPEAERWPVRERSLATTESLATAPYRYQPPEGVPPMRHFGAGRRLRVTGSSHDEWAFISKAPATVDALNRHLAAKIEAARDAIETVSLDLDPGARTLVIAYGVTAGALRDALSLARQAGQRVSGVTVQSLWPLPRNAIRRALQGIDRVVVAELNLGQYRREIERLAGTREVLGVHRVDGELIRPEQILEAIR